MNRDIYISPEGRFTWTGAVAEPSADGLDGPIPALGYAVTMARQLRRNGQSDGPVTCWLSDGVYPMTFPLELGAEDYGTIEFKARPGTKPILDGGVRIENWQEATVNGKAAWVADVSGFLLEFGPFRSLFVNGSRRRRSRFPESDWLWIEGAPDQPAELNMQAFNLELLRGSYRFKAQQGDLEPIDSWTNAEVVMLNRWTSERLPVRAYDPVSRIVEMGVRTRLVMHTEFSEPGKTIRYAIENVREGLLRPGDWYLDEDERKLYYLPMTGETPETAEVVAPAVKQFVRIRGDRDSLQLAGGVRFERITFRHSDWSQPCNLPGWWDPYAPDAPMPERSSFRPFTEGNNANPWIDTGTVPQAAFNLPGTIQMEFARDVAIMDCRVEHIGFHAVGIGEGCSAIRIIGNELTDMGGGGILMDGIDPHGDPRHLSGHSVMSDNHIHGGGHVFPAACGIALIHTVKNMVEHNEIHDMTYSGISCGWMWGLCDSVSHLHRLHANHIYNLGQRGGLSDMGGIYLLGPQPGTFVSGNYIHDIRSAAYGGWGIYPDEGSSFLTIENNVVADTGHESLHEHMGRQNVIRNNIFLMGGNGGVLFTRNARNRWINFPSEGGMFIGNIVVTQDRPAVREMLYYQERNPYSFELNTYWTGGGAAQPFGLMPPDQLAKRCYDETAMSLAERVESGLDNTSRIADPLVKLDGDGLTLDAESPARCLGFKSIDLTGIGPRQPGQRNGVTPFQLKGNHSDE